MMWLINHVSQEVTYSLLNILLWLKSILKSDRAEIARSASSVIKILRLSAFKNSADRLFDICCCENIGYQPIEKYEK